MTFPNMRRFLTHFWRSGIWRPSNWATRTFKYGFKWFFFTYISAFCKIAAVILVEISFNVIFIAKILKDKRHLRLLLNFRAMWKSLPPLLCSSTEIGYFVTDALLLMDFYKTLRTELNSKSSYLESSKDWFVSKLANKSYKCLFFTRHLLSISLICCWTNIYTVDLLWQYTWRK